MITWKHLHVDLGIGSWNRERTLVGKKKKKTGEILIKPVIQLFVLYQCLFPSFENYMIVMQIVDIRGSSEKGRWEFLHPFSKLKNYFQIKSLTLFSRYYLSSKMKIQRHRVIKWLYINLLSSTSSVSGLMVKHVFFHYPAIFKKNFIFTN